jgi:6-phosphofructokinase
VRADTFGYLQRSFVGLVSEVDAREAREVGRCAARAALRGQQLAGSVVILRAKGKRYTARYELTSLRNVARDTRRLDCALHQGLERRDAGLRRVPAAAGRAAAEVGRLSDFAPPGGKRRGSG